MKKSNHYNVVIIGGGIVGAGIFRDLALHGVDTLLIDKKDFTSQTSQSSSKMLHGGIRYLENYDFKLVWEALHEKNLWLKLAPHLCQEMPFCLPVYKESRFPLFMIKAGLQLYDLLSGFENSKHQTLNKQETLEIFPNIKTDGLKGSGVYYDAVVDDARLTLEVIYDALDEGNSSALNYQEVTKVIKEKDKYVIQVRDTITNEIKEFTSKYVVSALGPFTDSVLKKIYKKDWEDILLPSKGSHIWLDSKDFSLNRPMVLDMKDGRVIFLIPQRNRVLVGTTEISPEENVDFIDIKPSEKEIKYLLDAINEFFPFVNIDKKQIIHSYSGIRPLVKDKDCSLSDRGKTSREHQVFRPSKGFFVLAGGKYTTFRTMAQDVSRPICELMNKPYSEATTKRPLRRKSVFLPFIDDFANKDKILQSIKTEKPRTLEDLLVRRMGLFSRDFWTNKKVDFETFFHDILPEIREYINVTSGDIQQFK